MNWQTLLQLLFPSRDTVSLSEKMLSGLAALGGIGLVMLTSSFFLAPEGLPWVVASMGASAVLLFAVPFGPLSQPWPFAGGHLISGAIGITIAQLIPDLTIAATIAVSLAIFIMYITRSLHPPGGATALTVVMGGEAIRDLGFQFLITPVLINIAVMLGWALLINNLISNRYYPNTLRSVLEKRKKPVGDDKVTSPLTINREDLNFALKEMDEFIDVSEDDLNRIFNISATHARRRRMGEILCREIMTHHVISADYSTEVEALWELMWKHRIRGIPIVDHLQQVIGIVTIADFLNQAKTEGDNPLAERLITFIKRTPGISTDKPEFAGHIMTTPVVSIRDDQHILDLFPIFYAKGVHHLPVVDSENRLVGMLTPKNLLAALHSDISYKTDKES